MSQLNILNNKKAGRKVTLNKVASSLIEQSVQEIKGNKDFVKINESKLVSEIVIRFISKHYQKEKTDLEKSFFDKKGYLKTIIQNSKNDEELLATISLYINGQNKKGRRRKKQEQIQQDL